MASLKEALASSLNVAVPKNLKGYSTYGVHVTSARSHTLIFDVRVDEVPEALKRTIVMAGGGGSNSGAEKPERERTKLAWTQTDMESFLSACSVKSVHVSGLTTDYCRVYLNYEIDPKNPGLNFWSDYEAFIRELFAMTFKECKHYVDADKDRLVMTGSHMRSRTPDNSVYFR